MGEGETRISLPTRLCWSTVFSSKRRCPNQRSYRINQKLQERNPTFYPLRPFLQPNEGRRERRRERRQIWQGSKPYKASDWQHQQWQNQNCKWANCCPANQRVKGKWQTPLCQPWVLWDGTLCPSTGGQAQFRPHPNTERASATVKLWRTSQRGYHSFLARSKLGLASITTPDCRRRPKSAAISAASFPSLSSLRTRPSATIASMAWPLTSLTLTVDLDRYRSMQPRQANPHQYEGTEAYQHDHQAGGQPPDRHSNFQHPNGQTRELAKQR